MTPSKEGQAREIAAMLTKRQREAVLGCEEHGNGRYPYQLHPLAAAGLMAMTPVPELLMVEAYRLTPLGLAVRAHLQETDQ